MTFGPDRWPDNRLTLAYGEYFRAANVQFILPLFVLAVLVFQGASILSPYWSVCLLSVLWRASNINHSSKARLVARRVR